jgi:hypothetical protein
VEACPTIRRTGVTRGVLNIKDLVKTRWLPSTERWTRTCCAKGNRNQETRCGGYGMARASADHRGVRVRDSLAAGTRVRFTPRWPRPGYPGRQHSAFGSSQLRPTTSPCSSTPDPWQRPAQYRKKEDRSSLTPAAMVSSRQLLVPFLEVMRRRRYGTAWNKIPAGGDACAHFQVSNGRAKTAIGG